MKYCNGTRVPSELLTDTVMTLCYKSNQDERFLWHYGVTVISQGYQWGHKEIL